MNREEREKLYELMRKGGKSRQTTDTTLSTQTEQKPNPVDDKTKDTKKEKIEEKKPKNEKPKEEPKPKKEKLDINKLTEKETRERLEKLKQMQSAKTPTAKVEPVLEPTPKRVNLKQVFETSEAIREQKRLAREQEKARENEEKQKRLEEAKRQEEETRRRREELRKQEQSNFKQGLESQLKQGKKSNNDIVFDKNIDPNDTKAQLELLKKMRSATSEPSKSNVELEKKRVNLKNVFEASLSTREQKRLEREQEKAREQEEKRQRLEEERRRKEEQERKRQELRQDESVIDGLAKHLTTSLNKDELEQAQEQFDISVDARIKLSKIKKSQAEKEKLEREQKSKAEVEKKNSVKKAFETTLSAREQRRLEILREKEKQQEEKRRIQQEQLALEEEKKRRREEFLRARELEQKQSGVESKTVTLEEVLKSNKPLVKEPTNGDLKDTNNVASKSEDPTTVADIKKALEQSLGERERQRLERQLKKEQEKEKSRIAHEKKKLLDEQKRIKREELRRKKQEELALKKKQRPLTRAERILQRNQALAEENKDKSLPLEPNKRKEEQRRRMIIMILIVFFLIIALGIGVYWMYMTYIDTGSDGSVRVSIKIDDNEWGSGGNIIASVYAGAVNPGDTLYPNITIQNSYEVDRNLSGRWETIFVRFKVTGILYNSVDDINDPNMGTEIDADSVLTINPFGDDTYGRQTWVRYNEEIESQFVDTVTGNPIVTTDDGWYYYVGELQPNEQVRVLDSIYVDGERVDNMFAGKALKLQFEVQAVKVSFYNSIINREIFLDETSNSNGQTYYDPDTHWYLAPQAWINQIKEYYA